MECDSVLGQQSISGKNVSLILCVWKPCYVKSGHICTYIINLCNMLGVGFNGNHNFTIEYSASLQELVSVAFC